MTALPEHTRPASREGRLRAGYEARTESYEITVVTAVQGYTFKAAYHTVVSEEGWAGHADGVQETVNPISSRSRSPPSAQRSAKFLAVKLFAS